MRVSWAAAPGRVSHYRLRHVPSGGGREVSLKVPGTSVVLQRLRPLTSYNVTVHPIYKRGEGKARQGVGTTRTLVHHSTSLTDAATFSPSHTSTHTRAAFPPTVFLLPHLGFLQNSSGCGNTSGDKLNLKWGKSQGLKTETETGFLVNCGSVGTSAGCVCVLQPLDDTH